MQNDKLAIVFSSQSECLAAFSLSHSHTLEYGREQIDASANMNIKKLFHCFI